METVLLLPTKGGVVQKLLALKRIERLFPQMVPCIFKMRRNIVFLLQLHKRYKNLTCISYKWSKDKIKSKCGCLTSIYNNLKRIIGLSNPKHSQTLWLFLHHSDYLSINYWMPNISSEIVKGKKRKRRKLRHCLVLLTSNSSASVLAG